jgi:L-fuconolactonase
MIDAHHHLWHYHPAEYPWIPAHSALARDYLAADLEQTCREADIEATVVVQARQTLEETAWLLELAGKSPLIRGVVGWLPLATPQCESALESFAGNPRLKGARHVLQDEADDWFDLPAFDHGLSRLAKAGLRYDLLIRESQIPLATGLVDRHPDLPFILDHIAKPTIHRGRISPTWRAGMAELARRPQVVAVKLSGLVTECADLPPDEATLHAYLHETLDLFGSSRVLFGSDWPVCLLASPSYSHWADLFRRFTATLDPNTRHAVETANALRIYGLAANSRHAAGPQA